MATAWNGVIFPEVGDGILESWKAMAVGLGVGIPAASVAAARTLLTKAASEGNAPTAARPATFLVGSGVKRVQYISDGTKTADGVWVLSPINEVEAPIDTFGEVFITQAANTEYELTRTSLPTANYDRLVMAWGMCNAATTNIVGLRLKHEDVEMATARWEVSAPQQTINVTSSVVVPAGQQPDFILALTFGGTGDSIAHVSKAKGANRLQVAAFPITMA